MNGIDIVERLREPFGMSMYAYQSDMIDDMTGLMGRAADEIERLRAQVEALREEAEEEIADVTRRRVQQRQSETEGGEQVRSFEFDDGSRFALTAFAGGSAPGGAFSTVLCEYTEPDGTVTVMTYARIEQHKSAATREEITDTPDGASHA